MQLPDPAGEVPATLDTNDDGYLTAIDVLLIANQLEQFKSSWRPSAVVGGAPGQAEYRADDSNIDRRFDSSDRVQVFQRGHYEDLITGNSTFADGDWDGDGDFTTSDLVLAFQTGNDVASARPTATVIDWLFSGDDDTNQAGGYAT